MGTVVVGAILVGVVAFVIRSMIRDKKNGKSIQCGGDCRATVADIVIKNQRRRCTRAFFSLYADAFICAEKRIEHSKVCSFLEKIC